MKVYTIRKGGRLLYPNRSNTPFFATERGTKMRIGYERRWHERSKRWNKEFKEFDPSEYVVTEHWVAA